MAPRHLPRPCRLAVFCALVLLPAARPAAPIPFKESIRELPPIEALKKAHADGKYEMLLRQIKVPADRKKYGEFHDLGLRDVKTHAGFKELPNGYWVYVYPYWYVWRDRADQPKPAARNWGIEQTLGAPNTWPQEGDIVTAWASATPDGQDEWLLLEYEEPVVPAAVLVYETYNPGALARVTVFRLDGKEVEVWKGKDPSAVGSGKGISEVKFKVPFKTNRVKVYLESPKVAGWNEIDAVGLRDTAGKVHWAKSADASSIYGIAAVPVLAPVAPAPPAPAPVPIILPVAPPPMPMAPPPQPPQPRPDPRDKRIEKLEKEVENLKKEIKALKDQLKHQLERSRRLEALLKKPEKS